MKAIERIILRHRARKCKNNDTAGIGYLRSEIKKGHTIFDIGTHKAGYLYWMLKQAGNTGKVYAFEPQSTLCQYIKKVKRSFKWHNLTVEHLALSDATGTTTLYIPGNKWRKSSPAATVVEHKALQNTRTTEVVTTNTLDNYCSQHKIAPDLLKIDVEGNELKVLKGGLGTLKKYRPKIFVEIEARHIGQEKVVQTFSFMKSLGYKGFFIHKMNHFPLSSFRFDQYQNTSDMENYCNNFVFE